MDRLSVHNIANFVECQITEYVQMSETTIATLFFKAKPQGFGNIDIM